MLLRVSSIDDRWHDHRVKNKSAWRFKVAYAALLGLSGMIDGVTQNNQTNMQKHKTAVEKGEAKEAA